MRALISVAAAICAGIFVAAAIFVAVAWHSRKTERRNLPEAGKRRAKR